MAQKSGSDRINYRKKPQQDRSVQRVEQILAAARLLIGRHGMQGLKMTEIAAEAGVPIGSLYQYFPERAAIIKALFDRTAEAVQEKIRSSFHAVGSLEEALDIICSVTDWYYQQFRENPADFEILIATETDRDLIMLNVEDSRQVGELFYNSVRHLLPEDFPVDMSTRSFLFSHLIGSAIRLAVVAGEPLGRTLLNDWKTLIRDMLFHVPAGAGRRG
ncbi:TetR/AcrR family transcriptional regulator [Gellertiella hungarica]|uniref:AcrR family transcriptional regulator n=1 Tax=Gellertiella hungarica TaxID=1572859 RepID=A0A7W6J5A2_9HYPH|nr:TetR/AcrR family transcriptional regulator [Gellertiella hungarica]MBB4064262.1 AcrR family transcriptional regulator [Gellertiella hungarica]